MRKREDFCEELVRGGVSEIGEVFWREGFGENLGGCGESYIGLRGSTLNLVICLVEWW